MRRYDTRRAGLLLALLLCAAAVPFLLPSPGHAQNGGTLIKIDAPAESIDVGETFEVQVVVENVEHLASFSFDLQYDPLLVQPIEEEQQADGEASPEPTATGEDDSSSDPVPVLGDDIGLFLTTSERSENIICQGPATVDKSEDGVHDTVRVFCITPGPPVCLDGPEGASGSGVLASVPFNAVDAGETVLQLSESTFTLDDVPDCDIDSGTIEIPHAQESATVELVGDDFPWLIIGIVVAVVAAVLIVAGLGGLAFYRRRSTGAAP